MATSEHASQHASTSKVTLDDGVSGSSPAIQPPFKLNRASKDIAFGSFAGMVSKVFEHPFDLVKVRLQTQPSNLSTPLYRGAWDCFSQTYTKEGARGLFRGLSMPIFGATLENATLFFTYNFVQGKLRKIDGLATPSSSTSNASSSSLEQDAESPLPMRYLAVAAACAGAVTSVVLTPVELIKCKMQVQMVAREVETLAAAALAAKGQQPGASSAASLHHASSSSTPALGARGISSQAFKGLDGPVAIFKRVLQQEGLRGMWLGQTGTLLRETGGGVAWFLGFEWACRTMIEAKRAKDSNRKDGQAIITKKDLSSLQLIGAGALAGVSYNVVLFPADSAKSTMQTERELAANHGGAYKPRGFFATLTNIYRTRGIRGLYAGCGVTCLRSAPSSAIIFLLYNRLEALADSYGI